MDQEIINLYDEYTHVPLDRREFMERLTRLAGGAVLASEMLGLLENQYALAHQIAPDDERIDAGRISYTSKSGTVAAYLASPTGDAKSPAVIVIHENRGLNPHIEDVARRVAAEGFVTLAPDLLSPLGGTPTDEDQTLTMIGDLNSAKVVEDLEAARTWLAAHQSSTGKVGAVGFCWGGGMVNGLAVVDGEQNADVVFYGRAPDSDDVPKN